MLLRRKACNWKVPDSQVFLEGECLYLIVKGFLEL